MSEVIEAEKLKQIITKIETTLKNDNNNLTIKATTTINKAKL